MGVYTSTKPSHCTSIYYISTNDNLLFGIWHGMFIPDYHIITREEWDNQGGE